MALVWPFFVGVAVVVVCGSFVVRACAPVVGCSVIVVSVVMCAVVVIVSVSTPTSINKKPTQQRQP